MIDSSLPRARSRGHAGRDRPVPDEVPGLVHPAAPTVGRVVRTGPVSGLLARAEQTLVGHHEADLDRYAVGDGLAGHALDQRVRHDLPTAAGVTDGAGRVRRPGQCCVRRDALCHRQERR